MRGSWQLVFVCAAWAVATHGAPGGGSGDGGGDADDSAGPCRVLKGVCDCSSQGVEALASTPWRHLEVTKLDLRNNSLTTVPEGLKESVVEVDLASNLLTALPKASDLNPHTKVLDVSRNRISEATDELRTLSELEELQVHRNNLTSLVFLPEPCALHRLDASHNSISSLEGPLQNCINLETLTLKYNQLTSLSDDTFSKMANLKSLDLSKNRLSSVPDGSFKGLTELRHLDLSNTDLTDLPENIFDSLLLLETLDLRFNALSSLPDSTFATLTSLQTLRISHNMIDSFPVNVFEKLENLDRLDVSHNALKTLPPNALAGCPRLRHLSAAFNEFTSLPESAFSGLSQLTELDLSGNSLAALPAAVFSGLGDLRKVNLAKNLLESPPVDQLAHAGELEELDLGFNAISHLRAREFEPLSNLKRLELNGNHLVKRRACLSLFSSLDNLEWLFLDHNDLTELTDEHLEGLVRLHTLDVTFNRLTRLPSGEAFAELRDLAFLRATGNRLAALPELPTGCCAALRDASFWFNRLSAPAAAALRSWLGDGAALRYVDLRANPLRAAALRWALREDGAWPLAESRSGDRACGSVLRGRARMRFCVDAPERAGGGPADFRDWMEAARADAA
ncbi:Leucine-rich repeat protein soc-2 homolog [Gryllus bimaculatus]|nr:Leucine-rich repeat protein soc-2 homolog [Gryllus bimaculatus]